MDALTPEAVDALMSECLAGEDGKDGALLVEGIVCVYGFSRERIEAAKDRIKALTDELDDTFQESGGGGWSFLQMCQDKHGRQWTGLHSSMEALCCLAIAAGVGRWLTARDTWHIFPGGVPYVVFGAED